VRGDADCGEGGGDGDATPSTNGTCAMKVAGAFRARASNSHWRTAAIAAVSSRGIEYAIFASVTRPLVSIVTIT
jgi:hypothetical protein